jgi:aspartate--ammonia ligase
MLDKRKDLAGPGISTYAAVEKILPHDYESLLDVKRTQQAIYDVKEYIEKGLAKELNLMLVQVPLIVDAESGMNDMLDRDGSRTPVEFPCGLGLETPIRASIVQAATKWKRWALQQFQCDVHEGINTDMRAVRKDYFLDHDHSAYVDQWDWEQVITAEDRNLEYLTAIVKKIWKVFVGAEKMVMDKYPELQDPRFPSLPEELHFIHAEEILAKYPDLPRKERETKIIEEYGAVFIYGIGWVLEDGYPHEMRAADYDDWVTPTITKDTLREQMKIAEREDELSQPYHQRTTRFRCRSVVASVNHGCRCCCSEKRISAKSARRSGHNSSTTFARSTIFTFFAD